MFNDFLHCSNKIISQIMAQILYPNFVFIYASWKLLATLRLKFSITILSSKLNIIRKAIEIHALVLRCSPHTNVFKIAFFCSWELSQPPAKQITRALSISEANACQPTKISKITSIQAQKGPRIWKEIASQVSDLFWKFPAVNRGPIWLLWVEGPNFLKDG